TRKGEPALVRRPGRTVVIRFPMSELANLRAVRTHHVDVGAAVASTCKRDQPAVRRPRRLDRKEKACGSRGIAMSLRQPDLAPTLRAHAVDRVVAVTARGKDEVDPHRR